MSKKIMIVWTLIIVLLLSTLLILGNVQNDRKLYKLERELKSLTYDYLYDEDKLPGFNKTIVVDINELIDNEYITSTKKINEYCITKIEYTYRFVFSKCKFIMECPTTITNG